MQNLIYDYLLKSPENITPDSTGSIECRYLNHEEEGADMNPDTGIHSGVLYTCHQIYAEASAVLYGKNSFAFDQVPHS